jgi:hypothetical protein
MYVTQNSRQAKSDQAIVLTVVTLLIAATVWIVSKLLTR